MIVTTLDDCQRVECMHPLFHAFFDYVKSHDLLHTPCGRIEIMGDRLFINNSCPECVDADAQVLEAHRDYIDIHVLLEGRERIGWRPLHLCTDQTKPYTEADDCALYADRPTAYADLLPGQLLIAFPEDAHAPVIGHGRIRKLIGKVRI